MPQTVAWERKGMANSRSPSFLIYILMGQFQNQRLTSNDQSLGDALLIWMIAEAGWYIPTYFDQIIFQPFKRSLTEKNSWALL